MEALPENCSTSINRLIGPRARCVAQCVCKEWKALLSASSAWEELVFDDDGAGAHALNPASLVTLLRRSESGPRVLLLPRSKAAREAERKRRYNAGATAAVPTTAATAEALVRLLPRLEELRIDERSSCIGGLTDHLARALAAHCPQLRRLEVYFERYGRPCELFTDAGAIALAEGLGPSLQHLTLHNCFGVSNRSLYALAAHCPRLRTFEIGGYNEKIDGVGLGLLFESCPELETVRLASGLPNVDSEALTVLAARCPALKAVQLPSCATDSALLALAAGCPALASVDARRCALLTPAGVAAARAALPAGAVLRLPPPPPPEDGNLLPLVLSARCVSISDDSDDSLDD